MSSYPAGPSDLRFHRAFLLAAALLYVAWWLVVEAVLPGSYNPLAARLVAAAVPLVGLFATFASPELARRAEWLVVACGVAVTAQYFDLVRGNHAAPAWIAGACVVVPAIAVSLRTRPSLYTYATLATLAAVVVCLVDRALFRSIFLPAIATLVALSTAALSLRLRLLDDLAERSRQIERLFDATFEGIALVDAGEIVAVNNAFAAIVGDARASSLVGRRIEELLRATHDRDLDDELTAPLEGVVTNANGREIDVEIARKAYLHEGRNVRLFAVRDLRDRLRAEHERHRRERAESARRAAVGAVRMRDEFLSVASHELRTPLTPLRLELQSLLRASQKDGGVDIPAARVVRSVTAASRQIDRLERLVADLLDVSRLANGKLAIERAPCDLLTIARDVATALMRDAEIAKSTLTVSSIGGGERVNGNWDEMRLEQVVANLVRNAIAYGRGGAIELTVEDRSDVAILRVRDHGLGIAEDDFARIFERFERAVPSASYGGLGLGLYIVRQIVDAHGGTVRVESVVGEGATFVVELPRSLE